MQGFFYVFPAHAGMSRLPGDTWAGVIRFPRSRGDEPGVKSVAAAPIKFSPLTRG